MVNSETRDIGRECVYVCVRDMGRERERGIREGEREIDGFVDREREGGRIANGVKVNC